MERSEYYTKLGNNLLKIREKNELTQKDVATRLGITYQQYQKYEKGKNRMPTESVKIFCDLTGCSIAELTGASSTTEYEKVYKESIVNYNNTVHNYYGFFSKVFNMDLSLMKNKVVIASVLIAIITYIFFDVFKAFPSVDTKYHMVLLSIQWVVGFVAFAIALFAVFGYSLLTYGITFIAYKTLYSLVWRWLEVYYGDMPIIGINRVIGYAVIFALTFLTFYILKKCKINLNAGMQVNKKEA